MIETWEEIYEQYHMDEYPTFGGPFTNALTFKEWLEVYYTPPVRKDKDPEELLTNWKLTNGN
jgi:hypothetical protein